MAKHKITTGVILLLGTLFAAASGASPYGPGGNLGGHLGWAKASDSDEGNFLVGAHAEFRLIPWLGVQGSADYRFADEINFTNGGQAKVRSIPLTVTARLYVVATEQVSVFAAAGAGWYHLVYDFSDDLEALGLDDTSQNTFGWHLGAGVVVPISPTVGLYAEGRAVFADPDRVVDDELADDITDFDYDSTYLAGGVNFMF